MIIINTGIASEHESEVELECGKGSNVVASHKHYFLENHGHGEKTVYILAR